MEGQEGTRGDIEGHMSRHLWGHAGTRGDTRGQAGTCGEMCPNTCRDMRGHEGTRGDTGGHRGTHMDRSELRNETNDRN